MTDGNQPSEAMRALFVGIFRGLIGLAIVLAVIGAAAAARNWRQAHQPSPFEVAR